MIPARQKPSKKRRVLNMGTLTEKATARPNTSMNSTDMISTGWRPNLGNKVRNYFGASTPSTRRCFSHTCNIQKDERRQVVREDLTSQRGFRTSGTQRWIPPGGRTLRCGLSMPSHTQDSTVETNGYEHYLQEMYVRA